MKNDEVNAPVFVGCLESLIRPGLVCFGTCHEVRLAKNLKATSSRH